MDIKREIILKYLHNMVVDQLADKYESQGYKVRKEYKIGNYRADLFAKNKFESIVFEVKSGALTPEKKEKLKALSEYVKSKGKYKFKLVFAATPKDKKIKIENLEDILAKIFDDDMPDELYSLSTHTRFNEVSNIEVDRIDINKDGSIEVSGTGVVSVELKFGSDSDVKNDMSYTINESFSFKFTVVLEFSDGKYTLKEKRELKVDTSTFY
ncbi:MAG: hypothetical protein HQL03_13455 [Nitrospirae bacterium]|nr:hypothetical protein [Nitrospirota bacterium]MBF0591218.1 hypothetical protein [Nitrospirota bacterium]